eukprot:364496-Chlamydomonas_euryale.AAC.8
MEADAGGDATDRAIAAPVLPAPHLRALQEGGLASCDLLVSAFVAACTSYKRASLVAPFPGDLFGGVGGREKDFDALAATVAALPPLHALQPLGVSTHAHASTHGHADVHAHANIHGHAYEQQQQQQQQQPQRVLSGQQAMLLDWLLAPTGRRAIRMRHISLGRFRTQLSAMTAAGPQAHTALLPVSTPPEATPTYIFECTSTTSASPSRTSTSRPPVLAFHGTAFDRVHSILCTGLQPASNTRLMRNAAIFGDGVYLSTRYDVAFSFATPAPGWARSALGWKLRAVLVCQVDADASEATAAALADGSADRYVHVQTGT